MLNLAEKHSHPKLTINNSFKYDPTMTLMLRKRFVSDVNKRFRKLKGDIRKSIVDNDCFGLKDKSSKLKLMTPATVGQFDFPLSERKVTAFMDWLSEQEKLGILEVTTRPGMHPGIEGAWTDKYIQTAYQKGVLRARAELRKTGVNVPPTEAMPGGMSSVFNQPIHVDRIGLLYSRAFNELKGITESMNQDISRVLAQGIAEGRNPRELAKWLNSQIELPRVTVKIPGIGFRRLTSLQRARMLARTEVIRAHHSATIAEYRQFAVEGVRIKAEFLTAGYGVCPECEKLELRSKRKPYTLDEIEGMIPVHPNCRCVAIPALPKGKEKVTKAEPKKAKSIYSIPTKASGKKFTVGDAEAIAEYSESDYREIIRAQMGQRVHPIYGVTEEEIRPHLLKKAKEVENALLKLPGFEGTSYRGLSFPSLTQKQEYLSRFKEGGVFKFKAFQSCTTDRGIAAEFLGKFKNPMTLKIKGKSGRSISKISRHGEEKEILFNKGASFEVIKIEDDVIHLLEL